MDKLVEPGQTLLGSFAVPGDGVCVARLLMENCTPEQRRLLIEDSRQWLRHNPDLEQQSAEFSSIDEQILRLEQISFH